MTALQTIAWQNAQFDFDEFDMDAPPRHVRLAASEVAAWEHICERVTELTGETDRDEFPSHVDIATRSPRIRVEYDGHSATITVPYWYDGENAEVAIATAYAVGRIVEDETGLVGVDSQTAAGLASEHVARAVALYTGTGSAARKAAERLS